MSRARSQRASQNPSRPASNATAMRVIGRPFLMAPVLDSTGEPREEGRKVDTYGEDERAAEGAARGGPPPPHPHRTGMANELERFQLKSDQSRHVPSGAR